LKAGEYEYVNAAGLTRVNRFSPKQMGQMLLTVQHDFRVFPEFLAALPIGGTDGTLRSRMKNGAVGGGSIRAKTGLLDGVVGLAGFTGNADGAIHSFVFIFNGPPSREVAARALFDRIADRLAN
jgi:D-alanyl-D-alanine carboxypeptidase/D-alanyl-D-alanine-endopeptidase (penicillin-binding protein 4)